jgi:hypothetical protein
LPVLSCRSSLNIKINVSTAAIGFLTTFCGLAKFFVRGVEALQFNRSKKGIKSLLFGKGMLLPNKKYSQTAAPVALAKQKE